MIPPHARARLIVGGFVAVQVLLTTLTLVGGVAGFVRGGAVVAALYFAFVYVLLPRPPGRWPWELAAVATIIGLGTLVGALWVGEGQNSTRFWLAYSLIGAGWLAGLQAGWRSARHLDDRALATLLVTACLGDALLVVPRVFTFGMDQRSPLGASVWIGSTVMLLASGTLTRRWKWLAGFALTATLLGTLASGMRSSLLLGIGSLIPAFLYLLRARRIHGRAARRLIAAGLAVGAASLAALPWAMDSIERKLDLASRRMQATVFSEEGFQLDEDNGRDTEARWALQEFERRGSKVAPLVGYGHGFIYYNAFQDERLSHVHITPVAFYVRYGAIGLVVLAALMLGSARRALAAFRAARRGGDAQLLGWCVEMTLALLWLGSLIAGTFVALGSWWVLGLAVGMRARGRLAQQPVPRRLAVRGPRLAVPHLR